MTLNTFLASHTLLTVELGFNKLRFSKNGFNKLRFKNGFNKLRFSKLGFH